VPIQDITGSAVRINLPNSVGDHNWSYRYEETAESFLKNQAKLVKTIAKLAEARL
jgi:4-alpha-glucanotransferase